MAAALTGTLGLWLMLPPASLRGRAAGAVLSAIALGMLFALVPRVGNWFADAAFYVLAGVTVAAAAATVTLPNPLYAAVWFGLTLLGTAGLFLFQGAQFLAVATIVVYAGAILVTFLFVLMLAQPRGRAAYDRISWEALVSAASGAVMVGILAMTVTGVLAADDAPRPAPAAQIDRGVLAGEHVARFGAELLGRHLIAVEVAGTLLLAALVGAAVIVGKHRSIGPADDDSPLPRSEPGEVAQP
jgi:NADH-quinone oxidoreductase subunit J